MAKSFFKNPYSVNMLLLIVMTSSVFLHKSDAQTGVCYGTQGNNLPRATQVISLCEKHNIQRIRLFNPNPGVLEALQYTNISVTVGVKNEDIIGISNDMNLAKSWVRNNILKYQNVNFRYVSVGNDVDPSSNIAPRVAAAMVNIQVALVESGFRSVKVSTALSTRVLSQFNLPSEGKFRSEYISSFLLLIVSFLENNPSPFLLNVYPYFAHLNNTNIHLSYAMFTSPSSVVTDGEYQYQNLFDAMVDATHAALEKAGGPNVEIVVSETGWPSYGGKDTSLENAWIYNSNLIKSVKNGTPRKPDKGIEAYIFELIDENQKSGELQKHFGIFHADMSPKYSIQFD